MNAESVKIALVQMSCHEDKDENLRKAIAYLDEAAGQGANIICLQELFDSLYFCQTEDHAQFSLAQPIPGRATETLASVAARTGTVIVAGLFEQRSAGLYHNSAVVIDADGRLLGTYRKMHIPDDPHYFEKFYFTPGDTGFKSFATRYGNLGVCICWDQWFPEAARLTAMRGAQILLFPTAIGWLADDKQEFGESQLSAWTTMMRSHAIANGIYVAATNRVGTEGHIEFWGNSFVADPYGNQVAVAGQDDDQILFADCDFSLINTARTHWPFLRDRRIDAYESLASRWLDE